MPESADEGNGITQPPRATRVQARRVAIGKGAGCGLGRAMVRVAATAARERAEPETLAEEAGAESILPVLADVRRDADAQRVPTHGLERCRRVDILINDAGRRMRYASERFMTEPTRFREVEPETWRRLIDTNVNGPFLMAGTEVPHMIRAGCGRIIHIAMTHSTMRRPLAARREAGCG